MNAAVQKSKMVPVLVAAAVVVVLAGSLGARLLTRDEVDRLPAPRAAVPAPLLLAVNELEVPCWTCPMSSDWPLRFQTDLDLLAPLGTGGGNAAEWFALFAKKVGPRAAEVEQARSSRIDGPEWVGKILPPDHPLLLEAEPWCDQARMEFYPEYFALDGYATRIPDLLFALDLVRSWVARGLAQPDHEAAMADFRRAIRLGRLLRQEDVVVISDLVGLASIHIATRAVYERALADGDLETALLASVVLGEVAPQRLRTMQHLTSTDVLDGVHVSDSGEVELRLRPGKLDTVIEAATSSPDRRFRCEAIVGLNIIRNLGSVEESDRAREVLVELAAETDPKIASGANWSLDNPTDTELLKEWAVPANQ
jgi:hypothetical protein